MPIREPPWWYDERSHWRANILAPFALTWGLVARRRLERVQSKRAGLPVVCIGNFTAGGTGKTPLSVALAAALIERGHRPVFLTRGYGTSLNTPRFVDPVIHTAADVGDEALLLSRAAPVMVSADRTAGAAAIENSTINPTVILMDDGLQNPSLAKDVSIAVVDGNRGFGNGRVMPAGPLRAPLACQLALVDAIVINGGGETGARRREEIGGNFAGPVLLADATPEGDVAWLSGARVLAYCGIGHPERFFNLLERLGARIERRRVFADHHAFTGKDAALIVKAAKTDGCIPVTTEKDAVRLRGHTDARAELSRMTRTLPIQLTMAGDGLSQLLALIERAIARRSAALA